jgi:hypothetical protein
VSQRSSERKDEKWWGGIGGGDVVVGGGIIAEATAAATATAAVAIRQKGAADGERVLRGKGRRDPQPYSSAVALCML